MTRRQLLALLAAASAKGAFGQGVSSRGVRPQPRGKPSGRPFQATKRRRLEAANQ